MVLEYLGGGTLEDRLIPGEPYPDEETERIAGEIAAGLAHAHARGLVHRDLKPANVLFDDEGVTKIADFGIARLSGSGTLTETGTLLGTAAYISPEQAQGLPATAASDVYSFGVILYRMLAGRLPFESESPIELARMHIQEQPFPLADARPAAPTALAALAEASLAKDPQARPADGQALVQALSPGGEAPTLSDEPTIVAGGEPTRVIPRSPRSDRGRPPVPLPLRPRPCRQPSPFRLRRQRFRFRHHHHRHPLRDLDRHPATQRGTLDCPLVRGAPGCPGATRTGLGNRLCRRRLRGRVLRSVDPAACRQRERPRRASAPKLRQGGRAGGRIQPSPRRNRRHDRRRPPRRSGGDSSSAREARRGLRPRFGLADPSTRPAAPAGLVPSLQLGDGAGLGTASARHELRAEGVPRRSRSGHAPVRRAPPLHPGTGAIPRLPGGRTTRQPSGPRAWTLPLRGRALPSRVPGSPHGLVHRPLPPPAAAPVRRTWSHPRPDRVRDPHLPDGH